MTTPTYGSSRRISAYAEFFLNHSTPVRFTVYQRQAGRKRPVDLTYYDSVRLMIYDSDDAASLRQNVLLTVPTADVTDIDGTTLVAARATGNVVVVGATGNVVMKLVGVKSGSVYIFGFPWNAGIYSGGPTS